MSIRNIVFIIISIISVFASWVLVTETITAQTVQYSVTSNVQQDISSLNHIIKVNRQCTGTMFISSDNSFNSIYNSSINKSTQKRIINLSLNYSVSPGINCGLTLNNDHEIADDPVFKTLKTNRRLSAVCSYKPVDFLTLSGGFGGIITRDKRQSTQKILSDIKDSGNSQSLSASFYRSFNDRIDCSGSYQFSQDSQRLRANKRHHFDGTISYQLLNRNFITITTTQSNITESFPITVEQEIRENQSKSISLNIDDFKILAATLGLSGTNSTESSQHTINYRNDFKKIEREVNATIKYPILQTISLNCTIKRNIKKLKYRDTINDESDEERFFTASLSYNFAERIMFNISRTLQLIRIDFVDISNHNDRDNFQQNLVASLGYKFSSSCSLSLAVSKNVYKIVYIEKEMSANNYVSTIYRISPTLAFQPTRRVFITHFYDLNAKYILYDFDVERNILIRSLKIGSQLRYTCNESVRFDFAHELFVEDRGTYEQPGDGLFICNEGMRWENLALKINYQPTQNLIFSTSHVFNQTTEWVYRVNGETITKNPIRDIIQPSLIFNLSYKITEKYNFTLSISRRKGEYIKEQWDIFAMLTTNFF